MGERGRDFDGRPSFLTFFPFSLSLSLSLWVMVSRACIEAFFSRTQQRSLGRTPSHCPKRLRGEGRERETGRQRRRRRERKVSKETPRKEGEGRNHRTVRRSGSGLGMRNKGPLPSRAFPRVKGEIEGRVRKRHRPRKGDDETASRGNHGSRDWPLVGKGPIGVERTGPLQ